MATTCIGRYLPPRGAGFIRPVFFIGLRWSTP
jgi:hypothetical protein